jgi:(p)ppGpp synthase/HD superfamily hydrolase
VAVFSGRIERALAAALRAHAGRVRVFDGETPYVVHPVTVALILSRYTDDEDTIVAGLLHDTLEDARLPEAEIEREFGPRVLATVRDVTEPTLPGLSWDTRKTRYLRQLQTAPHPALLVAAADTIASLVSMIAAHALRGDAAFARAEVPPARQLAFYRDAYQVIQGAWSRCPLLTEFRNRLEEAVRKLVPRT